ncbi:MAG: DUF1772 domain-containing protein [Henriciella sp.]|uniref:anthrone oxygenase family protein n=1 Tax=Henriciella sp. TaxID=1968823 RepID=UPI0032EDC136
MSEHILVYTLLALGVASTLVAGVFQAFSDFVMRGLVAAEPMSGAQSMQMINRTVMRSVFLVLLLGLVPATLAVSLLAQFGVDGAARGWIHAGTAVYLVSVFLVTMLGNVPMNNRLDRMVPSEQATARYWDHYGRVWTRWNHVRTLGSFAAGLCFIVAALALA